VDYSDSYVLACRTYITESCTIQIPDADEVVVHPARVIRATVVSIEDLTHDVKRIILKPSKPLQFSPGQYVQVQFTPRHIRPYSLSGTSADANFELHVRMIPGGRVTAHIATSLHVGDTVRVSGPLGCAYLRRKHTGPILCVAGSTGLAPVLSILRGAVASALRNPVHVYYGVRAPRDLYGVEWLDQLCRQYPGMKINVVVSTGPDRGAQRSGLVTEAIDRDFASLVGWRAYLCGSPPMVEAAALLVRSKGMAADCIHADAFYPQGT
jgi:ferredoxin-NAD(P)+ reductase (naphthalene dioxygenase ferredoxin-specific)